jgi:hypothetical protein
VLPTPPSSVSTSSHTTPPPATSTASQGASAAGNDMAFLDPNFVNELLGSVDVDLNDPLIQAALAQLGAGGAAGGSSAGTNNGDGDSDASSNKKRKEPGH